MSAVEYDQDPSLAESLSQRPSNPDTREPLNKL
jgi:hypothetical protein